MKFLADMGISLLTVAWLRNAGYDIVHLREQGLQKLPDDEIVIKARTEGRIVLTVDLDFAQLLAVLIPVLSGSLSFLKRLIKFQFLECHWPGCA